MRKFKYPHSKRIRRKLLRNRIDLLNPEAKKRYKSNRLFFTVFGMLFWAMMIIFLVLMIFIEQLIEPVIGRTSFIILVIFCSLLLPAIILIYPFIKLEKKYPRQELEEIPREIITECNSSLFKFYKIPDDYVITKCYNSSNQRLKNKDLLLHIYKDKLRIVNDFTTTIRDFGCYEFDMIEMEIDYGKIGDLTTTEIRSKK